MNKFILGRKLNMTQIFDKNGLVLPATLVKVSPVTVSQIKTVEKDGYSAIQVSTKKDKKEAKKEFRVENTEKKSGDSIGMEIFKEGDMVNVSSISKGKGFQGVVKRHGFAGGPRTHGQKHSEREPGSIGGGLRNKVPKKMRMAGRMGGDRVTVKNLKVVHIDLDAQTLYIGGAIPGRRGTLVEITS
ncbi:MAG TPA: 50S ribosomal protein L3 [Candidatus Paceibacterota bacterium]